MKLNKLIILLLSSLLVLNNCKKEEEFETNPNAKIVDVKFYTSKGEFTVKLENKKAPKTAKNFLKLVDRKFYDGIIFHRVMKDFIVQGGDPTGTGSGGPGYTIDDEFNPDLSNTEKTISMANTGSDNSGGSQFFFNMTNNSFLDADKSPSSSKHAVFGRVTSGWSNVQAISNVSVNSNNRPNTNVTIDSVRRI